MINYPQPLLSKEGSQLHFDTPASLCCPPFLYGMNATKEKGCGSFVSHKKKAYLCNCFFYRFVRYDYYQTGYDTNCRHWGFGAYRRYGDDAEGGFLAEFLHPFAQYCRHHTLSERYVIYLEIFHSFTTNEDEIQHCNTR